MSSSADEVNFSVRTNKNVERKLIFDAVSVLESELPVRGYKYIGLGSIWFIDFILAHKKFTIDEMLSMEDDTKTYLRAVFNKPFNCICVDDRITTSALPEVDLNGPPVLSWLDYDSDLTGPFFDDFQLLCRRAPVGSILIATVNAHPNNYLDPRSGPKATLSDIRRIVDGQSTASDKINAIKARFEETQTKLERRYTGLKNAIDDELIPFDVEADDLTRESTPEVIAKIMFNAIDGYVSDRPGGIRLRRIFNFKYSDNAPMVTIGGVLSDSVTDDRIDSSGVMDMSFIPQFGEQVEIDLPNLTLQEKNAIDSLLPKCDGDQLTTDEIEDEVGIHLEQSEVESYRRFYRQYPTYGEVRQ